MEIVSNTAKTLKNGIKSQTLTIKNRNNTQWTKQK